MLPVGLYECKITNTHIPNTNIYVYEHFKNIMLQLRFEAEILKHSASAQKLDILIRKSVVHSM